MKKDDRKSIRNPFLYPRTPKVWQVLKKTKFKKNLAATRKEWERYGFSIAALREEKGRNAGKKRKPPAARKAPEKRKAPKARKGAKLLKKPSANRKRTSAKRQEVPPEVLQGINEGEVRDAIKMWQREHVTRDLPLPSLFLEPLEDGK